ncbi:DUF6522 family protein [Roseovarius pelagicus]|uniref:DUF6522 family protein n=1 Tax=Roseovarius pelagicus TaxID=2980108 RepID=A0ABY6DAB9_9RHOB|nr:DUF6522 family protein [Roseovarius pelagicus]UXX83097.1 DUF6522 family protein [Roseovarius pelagicus]
MSKVSVTADGFVVDAELLGAAFSVPPETIPTEMRDGNITSRCEIGVDADAGTSRLTFFRDGRALRLVVNLDGAVLSQSRFPVAPPNAAKVPEAKT